MAGAKGREAGEQASRRAGRQAGRQARSTKKSLPSGEHFPAASARAEFHDRVSGQQHAATQPTWGPPVLGPCQWHRPYRARSRSNRGVPRGTEGSRAIADRSPMRHDGPGPEHGRRRSSLVSTSRTASRRVAVGPSGGRGEAAGRSRTSAKCHPIPVCLPRRFAAS